MRECTSCNYKIDSDVSINHKQKPKENDYSVCFNCIVIGRFDKHLNLVPLNLSETVELMKKDKKNWEVLMNIVDEITDFKEKLKTE
jgi:hypothetical protein